MLRYALVALVAAALFSSAPATAEELPLLPIPSSVRPLPCASGGVPETVARTADAGALEIVNERWRALGLPALRPSDRPDVSVSRGSGPSQSYRLSVSDRRVRIVAADDDGAFYALMTLAQLPARRGGVWTMPCVAIDDAPALRWRILSDDVSRGPLPTMRYFRERIRTIASLKMNGYSPYMEHVFVDPKHPLPAPLDGMTPWQLRDLAAYARRFHVALVPEQQTFAHMHNTLKFERYANDAELPHAFLLNPTNDDARVYEAQLVRDELAAVPRPPFFHIGSDETSTLGEGTTRAYVARVGKTAAYAEHIRELDRVIAPSGARLMVWDDGIEADPSVMSLLPKNAVIVNWHYGAESTFLPYIRLIASGGFDQMVAPGARNWNNIYPDWDLASTNIERFVGEGEAQHVLGLFQTVWHDDGESLFESTWVPVAYSAANGWSGNRLNRHDFERRFTRTFFGDDDERFASDIEDLAFAQTALTHGAYEGSDFFFWSDPFDARVRSRLRDDEVRAARIAAERVEMHLLQYGPPLHANAARVMFLAARRYDVLGRRFQIGDEVRRYYDDARLNQGKPGNHALRDLFWCKYWFWEQRDWDEELAPLYAAAWRYENRESALGSNLERYHADAQTAIRRADRINHLAARLDDTPLPPLDMLLEPAP